MPPFLLAGALSRIESVLRVFTWLASHAVDLMFALMLLSGLFSWLAKSIEAFVRWRVAKAEGKAWPLKPWLVKLALALDYGVGFLGKLVRAVDFISASRRQVTERTASGKAPLPPPPVPKP